MLLFLSPKAEFKLFSLERSELVGWGEEGENKVRTKRSLISVSGVCVYG